MVLWSFISVNIFMELLIVGAGIWAYLKNRSMPALLLALSLFCFTLTHFSFLSSSAYISNIILFLRLLSYCGELTALFLLLKRNKKKR